MLAKMVKSAFSFNVFIIIFSVDDFQPNQLIKGKHYKKNQFLSKVVPKYFLPKKKSQKLIVIFTLNALQDK